MAKYFSEDHEWILVEDGIATVGITEHAAKLLGDIVFIELNEEGDTFEQGGEIGVIESVKAASDIYAPVDGEVIEANEAVVDAPASVNEAAEGDAWLYKIKITDESQLSELMDQAAYQAMIAD